VQDMMLLTIKPNIHNIFPRIIKYSAVLIRNLKAIEMASVELAQERNHAYLVLYFEFLLELCIQI